METEQEIRLLWYQRYNQLANIVDDNPSKRRLLEIFLTLDQSHYDKIGKPAKEAFELVCRERGW